MKFLNVLLGIILSNTSKYEKLKANDYTRQSSRFLGGMSIFSTVFGVVCAVLALGAINSMGVSSLDSLVITIGLFILAIVLIGLILEMIVNGLVCAILQMKLNRKPIGLISLILWFLAIITAVIIATVVIF